MNKHILGFIVFSLIFGVFAIAASFFVTLPPMPALEPVSEVSEVVYRGKKHCDRKKRKRRPKVVSETVSVKVSQAVFDVAKKQLDTQFLVERADESSENLDVVLHFFVNDGFTVQHIADEFISLNPNFDIGDTSMTNNVSSFRWLNNLESRENLYVISEVRSYSRYGHDRYDFDPLEATPVLVKPRSANK